MNVLRALLKRSVALRLLARWARANTYAYPNWDMILGADKDRWHTARRNAASGRRVLMATGVGGHPYAVALESLLAVALTLRGADVHFLLCDRLLPACELTEYTWYPDVGRFLGAGPQRGLCHVCFAPAARAYARLGLPVHTYGGLVTAAERLDVAATVEKLREDELRSYMVDGLALGEHAFAGTLRFFARGDLEQERHGLGVLRRYLQAALIAAAASRRALVTHGFGVAVAQHGIYVPQGVLGEVARSAGVRVVNWNVAYRKQRFIFSHGDTYHRTMLNEPMENWEDLALTPDVERQLLEYLESRADGSRDWIWFHERPIDDLDVITTRLKIDRSRPWIGMLTNVVWDAQIHYATNAFPDMLTWVMKTIQYFAQRPDLNLVIRVHPAEIRGTLPSRQPVVAAIRQHFPSLPSNVFVIGPEEPVSTYAVMLACDAVLIYATKTGVELASHGMPIIVAGEAWIRGKGLSWDAVDEPHYIRLLDQLPTGTRLPGELTRRARAYAYHFFFRRMIPLEFTEPVSGWLPFRLAVKSLDQLEPGSSRGLDTLCEGILHGAEFIFSEEQLMGVSAGDTVDSPTRPASPRGLAARAGPAPS